MCYEQEPRKYATLRLFLMVLALSFLASFTIGYAVLAHALPPGTSVEKSLVLQREPVRRLLHKVDNDGAHDHFHDVYKDWLRPDYPRNDPSAGCCHNQHCHPASWRIVRDHFEVFINTQWEQKWVEVPKEKILWRQQSPDGGAHLCNADFTILCFVPGQEASAAWGLEA